MYYTYILRCMDNSLYTGMTKDLTRRLRRTLLSVGDKCAKYTLRHKPEKLEMAWESENRVLASKLEFHIKKNLSKQEKEELIRNPKKLRELLEGKIDASEYKIIKIK